MNNQRKRRVNVDRDTVVVVANNLSSGAFYYEHPRMSMAIDLQQSGDEEDVTVGDLRVIMNSSRSTLEGFDILITDVISEEYTIQDVISFLGLTKQYDEYYSISEKDFDESTSVEDLEKFIVDSSYDSFKYNFEKINKRLRSKIIEVAVGMFKNDEFGDYNKMQLIQMHTKKDLFDDAVVSKEGRTE